jgi:hypothetical protein
VVVGPLTHRDKPFEELEDTEVALGRAETTRRARGCCGRRWWRRSLRMKSYNMLGLTTQKEFKCIVENQRGSEKYT